MWSLSPHALSSSAPNSVVTSQSSPQMSFSRHINRHALVLLSARGILAALLAACDTMASPQARALGAEHTRWKQASYMIDFFEGCNTAAQAIPTCPDCSRIPVASITPCSQQLVCGNDQNTYASACLALCQGVDVHSIGSCDGIEAVERRRQATANGHVHAELCPVETGSSYTPDGATQESATADTITHFLEEELHKFKGFHLLGKVDQKATNKRESANSLPQEKSLEVSSRQAIVRVDSSGNQYIRSVQPLHASPSSKHHRVSGSSKTLNISPHVSVSSSPGMEESFFPEHNVPVSQDLTVHGTSSHDTSSNSSQRTKSSLISRASDLFHLSGGQMSQQKTQKTNSHTHAPKQGMRGLNAIIGEDNRASVVSTEYPYTAIGQLRYNEAGTGAGFLCTGTLFSDRHVLTNAHCIYDRESGEFHSGWEFVPGLDSGAEPFGRVTYAFYDIYTDGYTSDFKNWDLAIVTLTEPVGLKTGWMGVKALPPAGTCTSDPLVLADLHTVGYPVEPTASSTAYQDVCDLNVRNGCLHEASSHTCDTKVGNSGSPLFQADGTDRSKWLIRAVHFAGLKDAAYNLAIPIDDTIFQWIDCYRAGNTACLANDLMPEMSQS